MIKKLRANAGESLVETLVAILVLAIASASLATMIMSAMRLNEKADAAQQQLYAEIEIAENRAGTEADLIYVGSLEVAVEVSGAQDELRSYKLGG